MFAILKVVAGPDKGRMFTLVEGETLTLGRCPDGLTDSSVAPEHCRLQSQGGQVQLTDCDSPAGTLVNGRRVTQTAVQAGDVIRLGTTRLALSWTDDDDVKTLSAHGS